MVELREGVSSMEVGPWNGLGRPWFSVGIKDANLALSLFSPQVAAPCIPPSSHELVVSESPFPTLLLSLPSFFSSFVTAAFRPKQAASPRGCWAIR